MSSFKKVFVSIMFLLFIGNAFASIDKIKQEIIPRHFTIVPPYKIESVVADTNLEAFSVIKTSENTFDVLWDFILPTHMSYATVKLWVVNANDNTDKSYGWFVSDNEGLGIQFIEAMNGPRINKIDNNNYQFIYGQPW